MKLQTFFEKAGKYSCLAQCYIVAVVLAVRKGTPLSNNVSLNMLIFETLQEAYMTSMLTEDFFVNDPVSLMKTALMLLGVTKKVDVTKMDIKSYDDLPLQSYAAVRHDYNGHSHWVLVHNHEIAYDSLEHSVCVANGTPTTARIITIS